MCSQPPPTPINTMTSKFQERIHSAAPEYRRLANILNSTDHAPRELSQQEGLITTLKSEITASDTRVAEAQRLAEEANHTKYQNSTFRRFAHKASGQSSKYTAKAAKEESEYLAAVQAEHAERNTTLLSIPNSPRPSLWRNHSSPPHRRIPKPRPI